NVCFILKSKHSWRRPRKRGRVAVWAIRERSLQTISYLSDAGISTRLVLLTAGCTRDADGTNYFVTSFDRHAATNCNHIRDLLQIGTLRLIGQILELK